MPSADWARHRPRRGPSTPRVVLPGSKSLTNRYLVLAALANDVSRLRAPLRSRDTLLMAGALRALGARVEDVDDGDWVVTPGRVRGGAEVDCGLAGNVMRFVPPVAGLADGPVALRRRRPRPTAADGARARRPADARRRRSTTTVAVRLPFTVRGRGTVRGGAVTLDASASSQFVSGLLLVGRALRRGRHRAPRRPGRAEPAAHRDDRRDAARRGGRRRRRRGRTPGGSSPARSTRSTSRSSPTCPTPRRSSPPRSSPAAGCTCRAGRSTRPRVATSCATSST